MSQLFRFLVIGLLFIQWGDQLGTNAKTANKRSIGLQGCSKVTEALLRGYEYFPGVGYYKFHSEGTHSFWDAKSICENEGGYLAIPNSQKEMNVYNQIYRRFSHVYNYAYLGFHDVHEEGRFVTIFGQRLQDTGYSKFEKWEPNNGYGSEDCGSIKQNGYLNDLRCKVDFLVPFFCEYNSV